MASQRDRRVWRRVGSVWSIPGLRRRLVTSRTAIVVEWKSRDGLCCRRLDTVGYWRGDVGSNFTTPKQEITNLYTHIVVIESTLSPWFRKWTMVIGTIKPNEERIQGAVAAILFDDCSQLYGPLNENCTWKRPERRWHINCIFHYLNSKLR